MSPEELAAYKFKFSYGYNWAWLLHEKYNLENRRIKQPDCVNLVVWESKVYYFLNIPYTPEQQRLLSQGF